MLLQLLNNAFSTVIIPELLLKLLLVVVVLLLSSPPHVASEELEPVKLVVRANLGDTERIHGVRVNKELSKHYLLVSRGVVDDALTPKIVNEIKAVVKKQVEEKREVDQQLFGAIVQATHVKEWHGWPTSWAFGWVFIHFPRGANHTSVTSLLREVGAASGRSVAAGGGQEAGGRFVQPPLVYQLAHLTQRLRLFDGGVMPDGGRMSSLTNSADELERQIQEEQTDVHSTLATTRELLAEMKSAIAEKVQSAGGLLIGHPREIDEATLADFHIRDKESRLIGNRQHFSPYMYWGCKKFDEMFHQLVAYKSNPAGGNPPVEVVAVLWYGVDELTVSAVEDVQDTYAYSLESCEDYRAFLHGIVTRPSHPHDGHDAEVELAKRLLLFTFLSKLVEESTSTGTMQGKHPQGLALRATTYAEVAASAPAAALPVFLERDCGLVLGPAKAGMYAVNLFHGREVLAQVLKAWGLGYSEYSQALMNEFTSSKCQSY